MLNHKNDDDKEVVLKVKIHLIQSNKAGQKPKYKGE